MAVEAKIMQQSPASQHLQTTYICSMDTTPGMDKGLSLCTNSHDVLCSHRSARDHGRAVTPSRPDPLHYPIASNT